MIGRSHRFHGYNSLRVVYRQGQAARSTWLGLKFVVRDRQRPYRAAVVVSRQVHKSAVIRNRIRRRIYECIRRHESLLTPGTDLIITVFSDRAATVEADKLDTVVKELLQKTSAQR